MSAAINQFGLYAFYVQHLDLLPHSQQQCQREYIDVPLPKSIAKAVATAAQAAEAPFVLKYNSCQPVNNL